MNHRIHKIINIDKEKLYNNKTKGKKIDDLAEDNKCSPKIILQLLAEHRASIGLKTHKVCNKCNLDKSWLFYYKDTRAADGMRPQCNPCWNKSRVGPRQHDGHYESPISKCEYCSKLIIKHDKCKHCEILLHNTKYALNENELSRTIRSKVNREYCNKCYKNKFTNKTYNDTDGMLMMMEVLFGM